MDLSLIKGTITGLKSASDIAKGFLELKSIADVQAKVIELQSVILSAQALLRLPDEQREVVLLVGLEQLSYAEAAEVLGVPMGTVMSRLARGRERLRRLLEEGASGQHGLRRVK